MKHEAANERLLDLAYGELAAREAREVAAHAEGCDACREELARIRETRALMAGLPVEPPPERGEAIVLAAARQAAEARRHRPLLPTWLWAGTAGAMAAAVVAVVSWQLLKAPEIGPLADRQSELVGAGPPALQEAPTATAPAAPPPPAATAKAKGASGWQPAEKERSASPVPARRAASEPAATAPSLRAAPPPAPAKKKAEALPALAQDRMTMERAPGAGWAPPARPAPEAADAFRDEDAGVLAGGRAEREMRSLPSSSPAEAPAAAAAPAPPAPRGRLAATPAARAPGAEEAMGFAEAREGDRSAAAPAAASRARAAPGSVEVRTFPDCPGERRRVVERAPDGGLLRYVREGSRRTVEQRYAGGRLVEAFEIVGGARRPLALDARGLVRSADEATIDAPPRCALP